MWQEGYVARERPQHYVRADEMTPPRSLGRCAPAVRLRRALPAYE